MSLTFNGKNITGTYAYDRVGQEIKLTGSLSAEGKLELTEFGEKNKPTGKFSCKQPFDDPVDRECYWSKPDGTGESFVSLNEQNLAFTGGLQIVRSSRIGKDASDSELLSEAQQLRKSYGGVHAVDGISFSVAAGELLAMIGPNGAGKSTCFNLLNGQIPPDAGTTSPHGVPRPASRRLKKRTMTSRPSDGGEARRVRNGSPSPDPSRGRVGSAVQA